MAQGLRARGHAVTLATAEAYRARVLAAGIGFAPLRPGLPDEEPDPVVLARLMDPRRGPARVWRLLVDAPIGDSHADLAAAAAAADPALILASPVVAAAPMVAEARGIPWAPAVLQPLTLFSAADPGIPSALPWLAHAEWLRHLLGRPLRAAARHFVRRWSPGVAALRQELRLAAATDPVLNVAVPPPFGLALFSGVLAAAQPDWPPATLPTGFPFWDEARELPPELAGFLAAGAPPLVFTLGSAAVHAAGGFFPASLEAARLLGRRAILLLGPPRNRAGLPDPLPPWAFATGYLPHATVFPAAAAIIHQGGIGTTAQAMRAGRPMLVVPFSHDQPDNAARLV
ncbi:MAG: UDP:flavonoid glycosyltransferase YjiC, YdhE family, partial [Belnapia sp.]|nr:UDP:flavonoid glycosyltransferase YjiC, YdhE family [Belnapia sp.]